MLPYISPTSPLHLGELHRRGDELVRSPIAAVYLPYISPISPLYVYIYRRGDELVRARVLDRLEVADQDCDEEVDHHEVAHEHRRDEEEAGGRAGALEGIEVDLVPGQG